MRGLKMKLAAVLGAAVLVGAGIAPGARADTVYQPADVLLPAVFFIPEGMAVDQSGDVYAAGFLLNGRLHKFDANRTETTFGTGDYKAVTVDSNHQTFGLTFSSNQIAAFNPNGVQTTIFGVGGGNLANGIATDPVGNVYVAGPAATVNERQAVTLPSGATGTFTLTFEGQTTTSISTTASGSTVRNALQALSTIGSGNVAVSRSGTTINVTFQGKFAGTDVPLMSADSSSLSSGTIAIATVVEASSYPVTGVREFSPTGTFKQVIGCSACPSPSGFAAPSGVGFDSSGDMYVADAGNSQVVKFTPSGGDPTDYTTVPPVAFDTGATSALTVDPVTGDFFVGGDDGSGYHVKGYHSDGSQFTDFGAGMFANYQTNFGLAPDQIAVDPVSKTIWVGDVSSDGTNFYVRIWGFAPVSAPSVSIEPASNDGQATATLNAQVDPNGNTVQDCHFEYGTDTSYGSSAPCAEEVGFGTDPVDVSADISGLNSNTTYHFKVVASNDGGTVESGDQTFTTLIDQPTATTGASSAVTKSSATIAGSVNPNNNPVTDCQFQYGAGTGYGTNVPCPTDPGSGGSDVPESIGLTGLAPATTYHYRLAATNAGGTNNGADGTFTTLPNAPVVTTGGSSALGPITAKITGSVNPQGATTSYHFEYGTTTAYGSSTPAGSAGGSSSQGVGAALSGLTPATTYHYRLTATNAGGTTKGADQTFTTSTRPIGHVEIPATAKLKGGAAKIPLDCKGVAIATCQGTLTLRARLKQGIRFILVKIGQADFQIAGGQTELVSVPLNGNGRKALAEAEGKPLKAVVSAGGANRQLRLFAKHRKRHG